MASAALEGTLDDLSLSELLGFLAAGRRTGTVSFGGLHAGTITVRQGAVTLALLDDGPSRHDLLRRGGADPDADPETVSRNQGLIEALEPAVHDHTLTMVARLLVEPDAPFSFLADETHDLGAGFGTPVADLLDAASARAAAWRRLREIVPSDDAVPALRPAPGGDPVTVTSTEWGCLIAVDGRRSAVDIAAQTGQSLFATIEAIASLIGRGLAELADAG